jgi:4-hydroxy-tetrahydrodipicolinate synthase
MKKILFQGSAVAIVTPFTSQGVDYDKLSKLCEFQIRNNTQAIVVAGTTGEASTMPDEEHIRVISHVIKSVDKRIPVIAGTGSNDTQHAIELSHKAQEAGADAILSVTPYYNKASQNGLFLHFRAIANSVKIPVILYNVPSRTSVNINPETLRKLSTVENIVAVKECNFSQVAETAGLCGDNLAIYSGEDGLILPMLSLGGKGIISVMANIIPNSVYQMVHAYFNGNHTLATELQVKFIPLIKALFCDVNPIPIKEAMNYLGYGVGNCRMPLCDMSAESRLLLHQILDTYALPKGDFL